MNAKTGILAGDRGKLLKEVLLILAAVLLLTAFVRAITLRRRLLEPSDSVALQTELHMLRNRWLGTRVQWERLASNNPRKPVQARSVPSAYRLVRIVDLDLCVRCIVDVALWNQAVSDPRLDGVLLLSGKPGKAVTSRIRALKNTDVKYATSEEILTQMGPLPPDTYLLLAGDGTVLMAHGQRVGNECSWSFPAQVGAVLGISAVTLIRPSAVAAGTK